MSNNNPELNKELSDAAALVEKLIIDIKHAEEAYNKKLNKHSNEAKEKLDRDLLISKKLKVISRTHLYVVLMGVCKCVFIYIVYILQTLFK